MSSYSAMSDLAFLASNGDKIKQFDDDENTAPPDIHSKDSLS
ncbi:hypothetical protein [Leptothermofonsia sp. ETS-13]